MHINLNLLMQSRCDFYTLNWRYLVHLYKSVYKMYKFTGDIAESNMHAVSSQSPAVPTETLSATAVTPASSSSAIGKSSDGDSGNSKKKSEHSDEDSSSKKKSKHSEDDREVLDEK